MSTRCLLPVQVRRLCTTLPELLTLTRSVLIRVKLQMHPDDFRQTFGYIHARLRTGVVTLGPSLVTIHPTDACNHRCSWCWFERSSASIDMLRTLKTVDALVSRSAAEIWVSGGGEPLLHARIRELLRYLAGNRNLRRRLYTHGGLLPRFDRAVCEAFDYVRISIDAGDPTLYASMHGTDPAAFQRLFCTARDMRCAGVDVGMSMVVTDENVASIPGLVDRCSEFGIPYVFLKPVMHGMWREPMPSSVELDALTDGAVNVCVRHAERRAWSSIEALPAPVASLSLTLNADNSIYPCCHLTSQDWRISEVGSPVDEAFIRHHESIAHAYAKTPHACLIHDAWYAWQVRCGRKSEAGSIPERFLPFVGQPIATLAAAAASEIAARGHRTIAITGPSSVGKTAFTDVIAESLRGLGIKCTTIRADDFLAARLRGHKKYRDHPSGLLTPGDFSFEALATALRRLENGESLTWEGYERGSGWSRSVQARPASVYLVEGLFLDSKGAAMSLSPDLTFVLEASPEAVATWRRRRDEAVRKRMGTDFRTERETEEEIVETIRAYAQYERGGEESRRIKIIVSTDHCVKAVEAESGRPAADWGSRPETEGNRL
jgi:uridine kinase/pyruvate-formate lyase-activating enzyme